MRTDREIYVNGFMRLSCEVSSVTGVPHLIGVGYVSTRKEIIFRILTAFLQLFLFGLN